MAGFLSRLFPSRRRQPPASPEAPWYSSAGIPVADPGIPMPLLERGRVEHFWRTQPHVRTVVDFIARNATVELHVFERTSDTDRRRVTDSPLAELMDHPRAGVGSYRFWHSVLSDALLYDRWAVLQYEDTKTGQVGLVQLPAWRLWFKVNSLRMVEQAWFWGGGDNQDQWEQLDLDALIFDYGYAPVTAGLSPVETLKDILEQDETAVQYRKQIQKNGGRATGYVSRPKDAEWTVEQRERFVTWLRSIFTGNGENAGGMMLLEDGMTAGSLDMFNPQDMQDLQARQLTAIEVASAFHIAPELIGAREGTYSNVDAYRQMLYNTSLTPYIKPWEQALNSQLVPRVESNPYVYVEANIDEKLRGSFIEQAQYMQTATGAPWLTRNEARARQNLPGMPGGDELVVPLNVLTGGQASPSDSGAQNRRSSGPVQVKSGPSKPQRDKGAEVMRGFFSRQERVVRGKLGRKADSDWWDEDRWNDELSDDLLKLSAAVADDVGKDTAKSLGYDAGDYDTDRTRNFLRAVADQRAESINAATRNQIEDALATDAPDDALDSVWNVAQGQRSDAAGSAVTATAAGFATTESAKQVTGGKATKTWNTGPNPREDHASMDGETVGIDDKFSNGMDWPGDSDDADQVAGCNCGVTVSVGD